jgi:hypothetical protein
MARGEDPMGLGRWSYVILRGKGAKKVAIITKRGPLSWRYNGQPTTNSHSLLAHLSEQPTNIPPSSPPIHLGYAIMD